MKVSAEVEDEEETKKVYYATGGGGGTDNPNTTLLNGNQKLINLNVLCIDADNDPFKWQYPTTAIRDCSM